MRTSCACSNSAGELVAAMRRSTDNEKKRYEKYSKAGTTTKKKSGSSDSGSDILGIGGRYLGTPSSESESKPLPATKKPTMVFNQALPSATALKPKARTPNNLKPPSNATSSARLPVHMGVIPIDLKYEEVYAGFSSSKYTDKEMSILSTACLFMDATRRSKLTRVRSPIPKVKMFQNR